MNNSASHLPASQTSTRPRASAWRSFFRGVILGAGSTAALAAAIVGLYMLKSSMGINLFEGRSPLHDILFPFVV